MQQLQWEEEAKDRDNVKDGCRGHDRNEKTGWQRTRTWGKDEDHIGSHGPQWTVALHKEIKKK